MHLPKMTEIQELYNGEYYASKLVLMTAHSVNYRNIPLIYTPKISIIKLSLFINFSNLLAKLYVLNNLTTCKQREMISKYLNQHC